MLLIFSTESYQEEEGETVVSTTLHIQRKREGVILLNVVTNYHTGLVILGFDG